VLGPNLRSDRRLATRDINARGKHYERKGEQGSGVPGINDVTSAPGEAESLTLSPSDESVVGLRILFFY
jgi:hypothetical protein